MFGSRQYATYGEYSDGLHTSLEAADSVSPPNEIQDWHGQIVALLLSSKKLIDQQSRHAETLESLILELPILNEHQEAARYIPDDVRTRLALAGCIEIEDGLEITEDDHSNGTEGAANLPVGQPIEGKVDYGGDLDYLSFQAEAGVLYEIEVAPLTLSGVIGKLTTDGEHPLEVITSNNGRGVVWEAPRSGEYFLIVDGNWVETGTYRVEVSRSLITDDHPGGTEEAAVIEHGEPADGMLEYRGDSDSFLFQASWGRKYRITVELGTLTDTVAYFIDPDGAGRALAKSGTALTLETLAESTGDYKIMVGATWHRDYAPGSYTLTATDIRKELEDKKAALDAERIALGFDDDHSDEYLGATDISVGTTVAGIIDYDVDWDLFRFSVEDDQLYFIDIESGPEISARTEVIEGDGDRSYTKNYHDGDTRHRIVFGREAADQYYIRVSSTRGTGPYTLTVRRSDDADDHSDSTESATAISVGEGTKGVIDHGDDLDFFVLRAKAGRLYEINPVGDRPRFSVEAAPFDADGNKLQQNSYYAGRGRLRYVFEAEESGSYFVKVWRNGAMGPYTLTVVETDPADDHANSADKATPISVGESAEGIVDYNGDLDYFRFNAEADETYKVELRHEQEGTPLIVLYDLEGNEVKQSSPGLYRRPWEIYWTAPKSGEYRIGVKGEYVSPGPYSLIVTAGAADDHGNGISEATRVSMGEIAPGEVEYLQDSDFFRFDANEGQLYQIDLLQGILPVLRLAVFNLERDRYALAFASSREDLRIFWTAPETGQFYAKVDGFDGRSGELGTYSLIISPSGLSSASEEDRGLAVGIVLGEMTSGEVEPHESPRFFRFAADKGQVYWIELELDSLPRSLAVLFDADGRRLEHFTNTGFNSRPSLLAWEAPESESYFVAVSHIWPSESGSFALKVSRVIDDHGNDRLSATRISAGETTQGILQFADDADNFRFTAESGRLYSVNFDPGSLASMIHDSYIRIHDSSLSQVDFTEIYGTSQAVWEATAPGDYFIAIVDPAGWNIGEYSLSVTPFDVPDIDDDHGGTWDTATELLGTAPELAELNYRGDIDFFCFKFQPTSYLDNVSLNYGTLSNADIDLYNSIGSIKLESSRNSKSYSSLSVAPAEASNTGLFCAAIYSALYDTGTYQVRAEYCRRSDKGCVP